MSDSTKVWRVWCHFYAEPAYVSAETYDEALAKANNELPNAAESAMIVYDFAQNRESEEAVPEYEGQPIFKGDFDDENE